MTAVRPETDMQLRRPNRLRLAALALVGGMVVAACVGGADAKTASITVYSGRSEALIGPLIEQFEQDGPPKWLRTFDRAT